MEPRQEHFVIINQQSVPTTRVNNGSHVPRYVYAYLFELNKNKRLPCEEIHLEFCLAALS